VVASPRIQERSFRTLALAWALAACSASGSAAADAGEARPGDGGPTDAGPGVPTGGLTADFRQWLTAHGYDAATYARDDLTEGSFGGRTTAGETLAHNPVVFVHGNSDKALGTMPAQDQTGWTASYEYFSQNGYSEAELYATTWGPADATQASAQYHSQAYVMQIRRFVEAVLAYTGASQVDIVAHSMGVTLARKVVLGGMATDENTGTYNVGPPLTGSVDAFVGIAGANLGLVACYETGPATPTCDATDGFYPGTLAGSTVTGRSAYLSDLLSSQGYEGAYRYSIWSTVDELIGFGDIVYGTPTSRLPGQTAEIEYQASPYGHVQLKDLTGAAQLSLVRDHVVP